MKRIFFLIIGLCVGICGCTSTAPYRSCFAHVNLDCKAESVEEKNGIPIAYVELTDQGLFQDRKQLTNALALLQNLAGQELNIVVFVHGWKHSAEVEDRDVEGFRNTILSAFVQSGRKDVKTVGIFVGWRGASLALPSLVQNITFYDRKSTAEHVARGSVRELFSYLQTIRSQAKSEKRKPIQLTLIGHSFGGLILYSAIAESLLSSVAESTYINNGPRLANPIADLVLLLNPAFEASRFEPLFQAAKSNPTDLQTKISQYSNNQRPIFISITSEADQATKVFFPLGRAVNSLFEHEGWTDQDDQTKIEYADRLEKKANVHTIGHMNRYRTHVLQAVSDSNLKELGALRIVCTKAESFEFGNPNIFPLWNMYASADVINGHSDIYRQDLWQYLTTFLDARPILSLCK